jgi:hypothetical protein
MEISTDRRRSDRGLVHAYGFEPLDDVRKWMQRRSG